MTQCTHGIHEATTICPTCGKPMCDSPECWNNHLAQACHHADMQEYYRTYPDQAPAELQELAKSDSS